MGISLWNNYLVSLNVSSKNDCIVLNTFWISCFDYQRTGLRDPQWTVSDFLGLTLEYPDLSLSLYIRQNSKWNLFFPNITTKWGLTLPKAIFPKPWRQHWNKEGIYFCSQLCWGGRQRDSGSLHCVRAPKIVYFETNIHLEVKFLLWILKKIYHIIL